MTTGNLAMHDTSSNGGASNPPLIRRRIKHTRSNRGCKVCRIRRVKCDLSRPACDRCTSTGRKCEGYPIDVDVPSKRRNHSTRPVTTQLLMLAPRSLPPMLSDEQRYFSYFPHHTASCFGGYFEDDQWGQLVLQMAMSEDSIRQIAIALGLVHENFNQSQGHFNLVHLLDKVGDTMQPYYKAMHHLQVLIATQGWTKVEVTLVACLLCVGFDWLQGDSESASIHLQAGLRILKCWYTNNKSIVTCPGLQSPSGRIIHQNIAPFYKRLALQTASMYDFSLPWPHFLTARREDNLPSSLYHARDSLVDIVGQIQLVPETRALLKGTGEKSVLARQRFERLLVDWKTNFDKYLAQHRDKVSTDSSRCSTLMIELLYLVTMVMLPVIHLDDTDAVGKHAETFQQILKTAEKILATSSPKFTIDLGVVPMVYYVAIHCAQPAIHRQACHILATHQIREGFWTSADALRDAEKKNRERQRSGKLKLELLRWSRCETTRLSSGRDRL